MKRLLLSILCVAVLVAAGAACTSKPADTATTPAASTAPASTLPPAATPPSTATTATPKKVEITDETVSKYMQYQKDVAGIVADYTAKSKKNLESSKGDPAKVMNQLSMADQLNKEIDAALAGRRKEIGLSEEEFSLLQEAVTMVANSRMLYNQMGGDAQVARIEAEQKQEIARMAPGKRAAAEAETAKMTESFRKMRDGFDVRQKYGDTAADVLMKHADDLARQHLENLKLAFGKK